MGGIKRRRILEIIATDRTFSLREQPGRAEPGSRRTWVGKCIHCNRRLVIDRDGTPISDATIEHIVPKNHGGQNDIDNLALACAACNTEKGRRHDIRRANDPKLQSIIQRLQRVRRERWRDPE